MELKSQAPVSPELPGHRSTLDDAHHLAADPVLDHRSPRHQRKFVGVLDQRELAARELDGLLEDALHRLAIAGGPKRQRPRGSECRAGADDIALFERGEQVATIEDTTIGMTDSVALLDQMLAATIHGLLHVPPETDRDQIGGTAPDQPAIEPGRAVSLDLPFQVQGRLPPPPMLTVADGGSDNRRLQPGERRLQEEILLIAGRAADTAQQLIWREAEEARGGEAQILGPDNLARCPDQHIGVPDRRHAMLGHAEHLHLDVISAVEDRLGTRRFRQREEWPLHQIALVARTGVTADHHEGIEAGPLALAQRAPPFLLDTERHSARPAFGRGQSASREI